MKHFGCISAANSVLFFKLNIVIDDAVSKVPKYRNSSDRIFVEGRVQLVIIV